MCDRGVEVGCVKAAYQRRRGEGICIVSEIGRVLQEERKGRGVCVCSGGAEVGCVTAEYQRRRGGRELHVQ